MAPDLPVTVPQPLTWARPCQWLGRARNAEPGLAQPGMPVEQPPGLDRETLRAGTDSPADRFNLKLAVTVTRFKLVRPGRRSYRDTGTSESRIRRSRRGTSPAASESFRALSV